MASSLASQLAKVRAHNADRLSSSKSAERSRAASYLFPANVAATQDYYMLHGLARNGWEELCNSDASYLKWGQVTGNAELLFGDASRELDRFTQTKEENERLDRAIASFYDIISDSLLDRSVAKCIEWLVRRFRVHEHNVEATLALFMPFHETNEFVRMLRIVNLTNKPHLSFLLPVQKQSAQLPASVLVSAAIHSPSTTPSLTTLRWVLSCYRTRQTRLPYVRAQTVARTFWLSTIIKICTQWSDEIVSGSQQMGLSSTASKKKARRDDDAQLILSVLLPSAADVVSSENAVADDCVVGCMAMCSIAGSFNLSTDAARSLLTCLASVTNASQKAQIASFSACAIICKQQFVDASEDEEDSHTLIDESLAHRLAQKVTTFAPALEQSAALCAPDVFFVHLATRLAHGLSQRATDTSKGGPEVAFSALRTILSIQGALIPADASKIVANMIASTPAALVSMLVDVVAPFRQRQAPIFDQAVRILQENTSQQAKREHDKKIWAVITGQESLEDSPSEMGVVLGASDSSVNTRLLALRKVLQSIQEGSLTSDDAYAKTTLLGAMSDDEAVVTEALFAEKDSLENVIGTSDLTRAIVDILGSNASILSEAQVSHMQYLLQHAFKTSVEASVRQEAWYKVIVPHLICSKPTHQASKAFYKALAQSRDGLGSSTWQEVLLNDIATQTTKPIEQEDWVRVNVVVIQSIAKVSTDMDEGDFSRLVRSLTHSAFKPITQDIAAVPGLRSWSLLLLANIVTKCSAPRRAVAIGKTLTQLTSDEGPMVAMDDSLLTTGAAVPDTVASTLYKKPSAQITLAQSKTFLARTIINQMSLEGCAVLGTPTPQHKLAHEAYTIALRAVHSDQQSGTQMATKLLQRLGDGALLFLASIWTNAEHFDNLTRLSALGFARSFISAFRGQRVRHIDFQTVVPSFLVALKDEDKKIRLEAFECLEAITAIADAIETQQKPGEGVQIYAYDALYGPSSAEHLRYLESRNLATFLQDIVSARASFANDSLHLNAFVSRRLAPRKEEGKKETGFKVAMLQYLLSHVVCWNHSPSQASLLESMDGISHQCKLETIMPLLRSMLAGVRSYPDDLVRLSFATYDRSAKRLVESDEHGCWTLFSAALLQGPAQLQRAAAKTLSSSLFTALSAQKQREILARVAQIVATSASPLPKEMRSLLSTLPVSTEILVSILTELRVQLAGNGQHSSPAKRNRNAPQEVREPINVSSVLGEVLESLLERKPPVSSQLVFELFEILRVSAELLFARVGSAEYLMQLSMSNLSRLLEMTSESSASQVSDALRIDTIVNIVKMPCRPQTFQQALLLMSAVGKVAPELVLHHSMPIFTFVGTSMLQRDDDYSFTVIEKTLQSILPAVADDLRKRNQKAHGNRFDLLQSSRTLLCVFTDAATHVPRHRRATFFQLLATALGTGDYLGALCMLLVDRQAGKISRLEESSLARDALQLPLMLLQHSEGDTDHQLLALEDIWQEIERTWSHRAEDPIEMQDHVFLDCVRGVDDEHDHGRVEPVRRIVALLHFAALAASSSRDSIEEERFDEDDEERSRRDRIVRSIIERALAMSRAPNAIVAASSQYALDATLTLVPVSTLGNVVSPLLKSGNADQERMCLSVVSKTLVNMTQDDRKQAQAFTPDVIGLAYRWLQGGKRVEDDAYLALEAISTIAVACTNAEHAVLARGLLTLCQLASQPNEAISLVALSVLQSLSTALGPRLIPNLANIVDTCCKNIAQAPDATTDRVAASLDVLSVIVRSVPTFASGYLDALFAVHVARPALLHIVSSRRLMSAIVVAVASGDVLQAVFAFYDKADKGQPGLPLFSLNIVQRCIKVLDRKKMLTHYKSIFRFIVQLMDLRRLSVSGEASYRDIAAADLDAIEAECVETFSRLVMKLNEGTFRPLFLRLCDWAILDLIEEETEEEEGQSQSRIESQARQVPLFKTLNSLLTQLGELIVHYYANVLDGTIETLEAMAVDEVANDALWMPLLHSITLSAKVDKGAFWNEGRVNKILPALIAQLTTPLVHGSLPHEQAVGAAISGLCQTVTTETCLKEANNRLLVLARDVGSTTSAGGYSAPATHKSSSTRSSMRTRVAAIRSMERLWSTKGCEDALLNLVPETVPSVAELLQETDAGVQEAMMALVAAIEAILGESLDAYLQ